MSESVRLVSVNIEFNKHLDRVENFFNAIQPDVVLLQEVLKADVPRLAGALGAASTYFAPMTLYVSGDTEAACGTCIISRLPVERAETHYYFGDGKNLRIAGSSNGRTSDSESEYLGSNPSPAARIFKERSDYKNSES